MGVAGSKPAPPPVEERGLTHIDASGHAHMVDVSAKPWTRRRAVARCLVILGGPPDGRPPDAGIVSTGPSASSWTDVLEAARVAGVQAAKQTSRLIPLCHALSGSDVQVNLSAVGDTVAVESRAEVIGPTGIEMEALTACAAAGLTLLSAVLPHHPDATIEDLALWEKSGGRSGTWKRT